MSLLWMEGGWVDEETMPSVVVRQKEGCCWDLVALGEGMLRLDPGEHRIWTLRQFAASEGGGEYNVARGLKRCFGLDAAIVTAFAKP
jgi:2-dehydro-3-deoxygluconokinase